MKRSDILVLRCENYLKQCEYDDIYDRLLQQKNYGLILLPKGITPVLMSDDVKVRFEHMDEKE